MYGSGCKLCKVLRARNGHILRFKRCYNDFWYQFLRLPLMRRCQALSHMTVGQACLLAALLHVVMLPVWPIATWCVPKASVTVTSSGSSPQ